MLPDSFLDSAVDIVNNSSNLSLPLPIPPPISLKSKNLQENDIKSNHKIQTLNLNLTKLNESPDITNSTTDTATIENARNLLLVFENEMSEIYPNFLYISGSKPASSFDMLQKHGIKRIINCGHLFIPNYFENTGLFQYISLDLLDSRDENIYPFLPKILHFILQAYNRKEKVLVHCEKGISRSCSFVIAYHIWKEQCNYTQAFAYIKSKRLICNPNTGFICNLIQFEQTLHTMKMQKCPTYVFRCASHSSVDSNTPILKLFTDANTRKAYIPSYTEFHSTGVHVILANNQLILPKQEDANDVHSNDTSDSSSIMYIWQGQYAQDEVVNLAVKLAEEFRDIFTSSSTEIHIIHERSEPLSFKELLTQKTTKSSYSCGRVIHENEYYDLFQLRTTTSATSSQEINDETCTKNVELSAIVPSSTDIQPSIVLTPRKPRLYTVNIDENGLNCWEYLGIYDEDDLNPDCVLLLLSTQGSENSSKNYIWLGGNCTTILGLNSTHANLQKWVESVNIPSDEQLIFPPQYYHSIEVIREGQESEEFWESFNRGV